MNIVEETWAWFANPAMWSGANGIPARIAEHVEYSALVLVVAAIIAIPLGVFVGHTGKGANLVVATTGALRALPTLGVLTLLALALGITIVAPVIALVLLAISPLLAGVYAGISTIDRSVIDSAKAQGMTQWQVLTKVEIPLAVPFIVGGFRNAALQVIATVPVMAYINLGGIGRYLIDGLAVSDYPRMVGAAILVVVLALVTDLILAFTQKRLLPKGK